MKESAEKIPPPGRTASSSFTRATPTKSKYFEGSDGDDDDDDDDDDGESEDLDDADESGYEDEDPSATDQQPSSGDEAETEDDYDSEEEDGKRKKGKPSQKRGSGGVRSLVGAVIEKGKELWRPGVKTGLGPGKQVFIEKPKPRGDGGIKYASDKIHPNTMAFLKDLKDNNDREWLKSESCRVPVAREIYSLVESSTDNASL